jgi:hypothetical protein
MASPAHLFSVEPAEQIRYRSEKGHNGNMIFRGANPASGATIDYWLAEEGTEVGLSVLNGEGQTVATLPAREGKGVNRVVWSLRHTLEGQPDDQPPRGPLVIPGTYTVRLSAGGVISETFLEVREDPRLEVDPEVRAQWTADLLALAKLATDAMAGAETMEELFEDVDESVDASRTVKEEAEDLLRQWSELSSRIRRLQGEVEGWVGPLTAQQRSQRAFYTDMLETLREEMTNLTARSGGASGEQIQ